MTTKHNDITILRSLTRQQVASGLEIRRREFASEFASDHEFRIKVTKKQAITAACAVMGRCEPFYYPEEYHCEPSGAPFDEAESLCVGAMVIGSRFRATVYCDPENGEWYLGAYGLFTHPDDPQGLDGTRPEPAVPSTDDILEAAFVLRALLLEANRPSVREWASFLAKPDAFPAEAT